MPKISGTINGKRLKHRARERAEKFRARVCGYSISD